LITFEKRNSLDYFFQYPRQIWKVETRTKIKHDLKQEKIAHTAQERNQTKMN
jgi:hypothetical protein